MRLKDETDRIEIMRKTVQLARKINHDFKMMADRDTFQQLFTEMPEEFKETNDHYFFDGVMLYRNDNISGCWIEFQ